MLIYIHLSNTPTHIRFLIRFHSPIVLILQYTCPSSSPDLNHLSFKEIGAINKYKNLPPAFALLKYGLTKVLEDQWDVEHDSINIPDRDRQKELLKKNGTFQGRPLYRHGLWDTLAHVLSKEAIDFLQHKGMIVLIHTHSCTHFSVHTRSCTHTFSYTHSLIHTRSHTHTFSYTHILIHTLSYTQTFVYTHFFIHTL